MSLHSGCFMPCPNCGERLTYEKPYPETLETPAEHADLYCEMCEWRCEDPINDYLICEPY